MAPGRRAVVEHCEQSPRRLRTDYVDLLWLHNWDRGTPIEETLRALDDLVRDGKVRYVGFSDVPAWVASEAQTIARFRGWSPVVAFQLEYSLLARTVEGALIPMAQAHGMGVMPWSPLKNGHLSGKYRRDGAVPDDARRSGMISGTSDAGWAIVEELDTVADEIGAEPAAVAIAWVMRRPGVASTLLGARTVPQLRPTSPRSTTRTALGWTRCQRPSSTSPPSTTHTPRSCSSPVQRSTASPTPPTRRRRAT